MFTTIEIFVTFQTFFNLINVDSLYFSSLFLLKFNLIDLFQIVESFILVLLLLTAFMKHKIAYSIPELPITKIFPKDLFVSIWKSYASGMRA